MMLGVTFMRIARPFIMLAENTRPSRIPFPCPVASARYSSLSDRSWDLKELRSEKTLAKYVNKALEMKSKWDDPALLAEVQKKIDKGFLKACETGEVGIVHRIVEFEYYHECSLADKKKLPDVKLSHIHKDDLYVITNLLLEKGVKKLAIEDFEWALVHKNGYFFQFLLRYLANDKPACQLPIKDLALEEDCRGMEDPIYGSYEFILEHPRLKPFQKLARTHYDQYNADLLATCERTIKRIQNQEHLNLLKNLHAAKDYSSLHWISRNSMWDP